MPFAPVFSPHLQTATGDQWQLPFVGGGFRDFLFYDGLGTDAV